MSLWAVAQREVGRSGTHLSIINFAGREQGRQRVVAGNDKTSDVNEELAGDVKEDQEEVKCRDTQNSVDLGHRRLLLEIVESGVFRQLGAHKVVSDMFSVLMIMRQLHRASQSSTLVIACQRQKRALTSLSSCEMWDWARSW